MTPASGMANSEWQKDTKLHMNETLLQHCDSWSFIDFIIDQEVAQGLESAPKAVVASRHYKLLSNCHAVVARSGSVAWQPRDERAPSRGPGHAISNVTWLLFSWQAQPARSKKLPPARNFHEQIFSVFFSASQSTSYKGKCSLRIAQG